MQEHFGAGRSRTCALAFRALRLVVDTAHYLCATRLIPKLGFVLLRINSPFASHDPLQEIDVYGRSPKGYPSPRLDALLGEYSQPLSNEPCIAGFAAIPKSRQQRFVVPHGSRTGDSAPADRYGQPQHPDNG